MGKELDDTKEVQKTKENANLRIHIERAINKIKIIEFLKEHCPLL